jgi:hypothetical protein
LLLTTSFEVLAEIRPIYESVTSFLRRVVEHDWGVARSAASQALQAIEEAAIGEEVL